MTSSSNTAPDAVPARQGARDIKDLPGPFAWPLLGNALQVRRLRIHQDVERWAVQYGPLFKMRFGRTSVLVVADHEAINAILRDRPDGFRRPAITTEISTEMGGRPGIFLAEGADWRNQRRMVMASFAPHAIKSYFPTLVKVGLRLQGRWDKAARSDAAIDLMSDLKRYTVDIIAGLAFGTEVNTLESGENTIQQHLDSVLPAVARRSVALFPYWRYIRLPSDRRLDRSYKQFTQTVNTLVSNARERLRSDPTPDDKPRNLLEAMIMAADRSDSGVDDVTVAGNVGTMLLAGEDTTANTLAWMLHLLRRNPQALARAQEEVLRIAPDPAAFTIEQLDALDYLDACTQETMRLKPVAPFIPLEALRETVVGDVRVPGGSLLWCVLRHESVDPNVVASAAVFDPQRWLAQGEAAASMDKRLTAPFGSGPRMCPGRYLALLEIKIAMAMLLSRFEIVAVDTPDGREAQELMGFVMSPIGLSMRLRARAA